MKLLKKVVVFILTLESKLILRTYRPFIIAVTGSVGKTSTKDAIYSVLKDQSRYVRKSEKNLNSEIGLPLTVIGVPNAWHSVAGWLSNIRAGLRLIVSRQEYPDCLILEVGADHPGDIRKVAKWLKPDIAVITRVSSMPVHVEFFASPEAVFEEKASLADRIKAGGTVILFADEKGMSIARRPLVKGARIISFGLASEADVRASQYVMTYSDSEGMRIPTGFSFQLEIDATRSPISMKGILGEAYVYPLLAAAAVGKAKGMKPEQISRSISAYGAPKGRMNIIPGKNNSTIIDDTYNSSPDAVEAALETLKKLETNGTSRRIAILGDMMELGKYSADEHRKAGALAAGIVSRLVTVGQRSRGTALEAIAHGLSANAVESFDSAQDAALHMRDLIQTGDLILVKGSQSIRMESIVKVLMNEPEKAGELLVRQEKEWLEKE